MRTILAATALLSPLTAYAAPAPQFGDPVVVSDDLTLDPILDARLRYENVDQPALDADAVTMRLRAGFEAKVHRLSLLAEAEGSLAIDDNYNAFSFPVVSSQRRPGYAVVADPVNLELNRLQLQYRTPAAMVTVGRQRINLDDQRWVGSSGWRQNEQTFDAVRGEAKLGPVSIDGTYAISQRTVFGLDAGPRTAYDGSFFFGGVGVKAGAVQVKGFAYLLDYDAVEQTGTLALINADTQTYGIRATTALPLAPSLKLNLTASYARQMDYHENPANYSAQYVNGEAGVTYRALTATGGYELLGSDNGRAVQTPMATLHKFNGWADVFLVTPAAGLEDVYGGVAYKFDGVRALPGLNAAVWYHDFRSDAGHLNYGHEWDASLGFKVHRVGIIAKYADYQADGFGVDTRKFWLQAEFGF